MPDSDVGRAVSISHSQIQGFVQQNYGTISFVYNFPQGASSTSPVAVDNTDFHLPACPYRGLFTFQPEDSHLYFGRDAAVDRMLRLVKRGRLSAVTGTSGSGKSSLVFAGLVPALVAQEAWHFTTFRPGEDPIYALAGALAPLLISPQTPPASAREPSASLEADRSLSITNLASELRSSPANIIKRLSEINQRSPNKKILIIADQFETLYSVCSQPELRGQFLELLLAAISSPETTYLRVVLTIRADFLGELVSFRGLANALQNQIDLLGPMTRVELAEAVTKPAALMGVSYEARLVDRILDDLGDDEGALPLLEFALTQLWGKQSADRVLTHTVYEEIGRVSGAIRQHAQAAYDRLDQNERMLTRRLFGRLVSVPTGDEQGDRLTRRQVELQSLDAAMQTLAKRELANRRLVFISHVSDQRDTVEIVHEALLTNWPELAAWIREDRATILRLQALSTAAAAYSNASNNPDLLYRGRQLRDILAWAVTHKAELTTSERDFLSTSQKYQQRRSLILFGGYALTALVIPLAAVWLMWFGATKPQIPIPMPADDFNFAVANFSIDGADTITDQGVADALRRDASAVANQLTEALQRLETSFSTELGVDVQVNVLPPDRFELDASDPAAAARVAKELNANILVYGALRKGDGRQWTIQPRFFINDSAIEDRAGEVMDDQSIAELASFIPGLALDRNQAIQKLGPSLEVIFALYRGLNAYDQGTVADYQEAAQILCDSAAKLQKRGVIHGVDMLLLFCGHSYSELLVLENPPKDRRAEYLQKAINAYRSAIKLNPAGMRAQVSLPALLITVYEPDLSCVGGDMARIEEAGKLLEDAAAFIDSAVLIRQGTLHGYLLNRGHVLFWLGLCQDFDHREQDWRAARVFYQQVLALTNGKNIERPDILALSLASAHAQLAHISLLADFFNAQGGAIFAEEADSLLADAVRHFDASLALLLPYQTEQHIARYARTIAANSVYTFCKARRQDLAQKYMTSYTRLAIPWSAEEIRTDLDSLDSQLRKECGL